jgi:NADH:ubiquinone oxidoreductase subunit 6 (subunit J)
MKELSTIETWIVLLISSAEAVLGGAFVCKLLFFAPDTIFLNIWPDMAMQIFVYVGVIVILAFIVTLTTNVAIAEFVKTSIYNSVRRDIESE